MPQRYQQFLGTNPGTVVELIDDSSSPYLVRTEDGFEFAVSADDFKNYYRQHGSVTPRRWKHLMTDKDRGIVESAKMAEVMNVVNSFENTFRNFDKARSFVRDAVKAMKERPRPDLKQVKARLKALGWELEAVQESDLKKLEQVPESIAGLLMSDTVAVMPFLGSAMESAGGVAAAAQPTAAAGREAGHAKAPAARKVPAKTNARGMKNVEFEIKGDTLTITVDLSKEFGPSKSGKTTIIASSQGTKKVPGREERVGLNVYKQESKRPTKGRRNEFKNVLMSVQGDVLTVTVDLSKEFGPSKSGQTIIIASTEGNQPVYGREERIGLNIYKKIE